MPDLNTVKGAIVCPVSVVIPTYGREQVLIDTIGYLLQQQPAAAEILVIDQTEQHTFEVEGMLHGWSRDSVIHWHRLAQPSITAAMNRGLNAAQSPIVLFLDDDIIPAAGLVRGHCECYSDPRVWAAVGQVLQPGQVEIDADASDVQRGAGLRADLGFPFNSSRRALVRNCMAGNLSVRRRRAIGAGGFDENFRGIAHRFETEFARRIVRCGGAVLFEPAASIRHLQVSSGGTRCYSDRLRSPKPDHSVGDYYFAFREAQGLERWSYVLTRFFRSVRTRYHLTHPWYIPVKWLGELRGLLWAARLHRGGPKYLALGDELEGSCA